MSIETLINESTLIISSLVETQNLSFITSLNQKAAALTNEGKDIIKLSGGDPSHIPEKLLAILQDLCNSPRKSMFKYSPIAGYDTLRTLIASISSAQYKNRVNKDNILVCSGGCSGLFLTFKTILNPGDRVLIQDPCWEYLPRLIENAGGVSVRMNYFSSPFSEDNWDQFVDEIHNHLMDGIRVIAINSPLNPSGKIIPLYVKNRIIQLCNTHNAWLVSDDVTADFNYIENKQTHSIDNLQNFISVNSFSKNLGITGLRFGFISACDSLINQLKKSQLYTFMYPNSLVQCLIESYLSCGEDEYFGFIEKTIASYKANAKEYTNLLSSISHLDIQCPDGGLFLFPKLQSNRVLDFDKLLSQYLITVAPGAAFSSSCESYFRIFLGVNANSMKTLANALKTM